MSEELRTEELLTNEGHTETMADYEDHFDDANPWNRVLEYMEKKTILPVKIEGIVNGGAIAMVEGLRGFIPVSKLSLSYIEDLETYLLKDVEVQVIDVDQAGNRLVLSARELLKEKERKEKEAQIASIPIGTVMSGTVETLQNYGAFVKLENGLSGLVHVSQISQKRIKNPAAVLNVGDEVQVKVIGIKAFFSFPVPTNRSLSNTGSSLHKIFLLLLLLRSQCRSASCQVPVLPVLLQSRQYDSRRTL